MKHVRSIKCRGDTIIEVLVVLAVLGLAISVSYATAARSLLDARQAQEATEAANLAQSQLEALRTLVANPTIFTNGSSQAYCINASSEPFMPVLVSTGSCSNLMNLYNVSIIGPGSSSGGLFAITISWPDVEGNGTDTSSLEYRLYPS